MLEELIDRFGEPPKSVENLLTLAEYKAKAHRLYFTEVTQKGDEIKFTLFERARVNPAKIPEFVAGYGGRMRFCADKKTPCFFYRLKMNSRQKESAMEAVEAVLAGANMLLSS